MPNMFNDALNIHGKNTLEIKAYTHTHAYTCKCYHFTYKVIYYNTHKYAYMGIYIHVYFLPHLLNEMVAFTEDKNEHKYKCREIENKLQRHSNAYILALTNM